ncbi:MAG: hypothetical protein PHI36_09985 [Bacteroidales bacterium]|nr:hypothetical protein [Bacteroidales bacterium]MDD4576745.1 hypothetical protein [Bacteroidales bacterium]
MKNQKTPFKVPDNYFEQLTETVMENVKTQELGSPKKSFSMWAKYASAAAVLIFVISFAAIKLQQEETIVVELDTITEINNFSPSEDVYIEPQNGESKEFLSQDAIDNDIVDWSTSMDLDDEEFYLLINYY